MKTTGAHGALNLGYWAAVSRGIALRRALTIFAFTLALTGLACILAAAGVAEVGNRTLIAGFVFFGVAAVLDASRNNVRKLQVLGISMRAARNI